MLLDRQGVGIGGRGRVYLRRVRWWGGSGSAARVDRQETRSASRDPRPRRPNLWMQLGHDKVAAAHFLRGNGSARAGELVARALAWSGYAARVDWREARSKER